MDLNGVRIKTEKGGPQGAVLSPANWNLYSADLAKNLMNMKDDTLESFATQSNFKLK
jgi:hypothetical protein